MHLHKNHQNTQILKIADFAIQSGFPTSEITKKKANNGSLNRNLLNFLSRYGIHLLVPDESSCPHCPGGSENVCQRGVEGV